MNLMLVLEHHFFFDDAGNTYCERIISYDYLKRYLQVFDNVFVLARCAEISGHDKESMLLSSGNGIYFIPLNDIAGEKINMSFVNNIADKLSETKNMVDCYLLRTPSVISILAYHFVKRNKKPIALEMAMGADQMIPNATIANRMICKLVDKYVKYMCMDVDGVAYVTDKILQRKYPCKAIKGKTGYTESYSSIDIPDELFCSQKWNANAVPETICLINTGYMDSYRKGQDIVIKAAAILIERGYNISLELIGDGDKRQELESLTKELGINDRVNFCGEIRNQNTLLEHLRKAHIFVLPSRKEGLPRAIIEAMASGLVCVASNVDGIPELLEDKMMAKTFDPMEYAEIIQNCITDWQYMVKNSTENYERSLRYSKTKLNEKRKNFYRMLSESCIVSNN